MLCRHTLDSHKLAVSPDWSAYQTRGDVVAWIENALGPGSWSIVLMDWTLASYSNLKNALYTQDANPCTSSASLSVLLSFSLAYSF